MTTKLLLGCLLVLLLARAVAQFDNGILGDPYVNCGGNHIEVRFDTRNTFRGIVFVEDHLEDPQCRSAPVDSSTNGARNASIRLNFKDCGLEKKRSSNPRGIFITGSLIVAFHPEVLTKFDRVFVVQCYYMEMEKILEREILVKMPPPSLQTQQVPMPVCKYEVLSGGPEGPPVFYAVVGQQVYHKWTCDSSQENQFCMVVHSCTVDDGNGDRVELLDQKGCAKDKFLLQNLDYVSDLVVGKEAHVYKYADRQSMFFDCQITLTIKEPGQQYCDVPNCPDPPRRRRAQKEEDTAKPTFAKESQTVTKEMETHFTIRSEDLERPTWLSNHFELSQADICMSFGGAGSVAVLNTLMMVSSGILFFHAIKKARA